MGWMMGLFLLFGLFINGVMMVMYEGVLDFLEVDWLWEIVDKYEIIYLGILLMLI